MDQLHASMASVLEVKLQVSLSWIILINKSMQKNYVKIKIEMPDFNMKNNHENKRKCPIEQ